VLSSVFCLLSSVFFLFLRFCVSVLGASALGVPKINPSKATNPVTLATDAAVACCQLLHGLCLA